MSAKILTLGVRAGRGNRIITPADPFFAGQEIVRATLVSWVWNKVVNVEHTKVTPKIAVFPPYMFGQTTGYENKSIGEFQLNDVCSAPLYFTYMGALVYIDAMLSHLIDTVDVELVVHPMSARAYVKPVVPFA